MSGGDGRGVREGADDANRDRSNGNHNDAMGRAVRLREARSERWEREGERPLWLNLSMIGALGWLIVVPILLGIFVGRWLDGSLGTGTLFTGALIFLGAGVGGMLAWRRMNSDD